MTSSNWHANRESLTRSQSNHRPISALIGLLGLALILSGTFLVSPDEAQAQRDRRESPCAIDVGKWADPTLLWLGEQTRLTLTTTTHCPSQKIPLNIVLSIDASLSMNPNNKLRDAQNAARQFVNQIDFEVSKVGVTSFSDKGYVETDLTDSRGRVLGAINGLDTELGTDIEGGLRETQKILQRARLTSDPDLPEPQEVVIILSDGLPWPRERHGRSVAGQLKGQGAIIFSICVGGDCDRSLMRGFASEPRFFFDVRGSGGLYRAYQEIADRLLESELRRMTVTDVLPDNMRYVPGSAEPEPFNIEGQSISWMYSVIPKEGVTITLDVEPLEVGVWPTNVEAKAEFRDNENRIGEVIFPVPEVEVREPPTPTPTLTPSPTPTPTPTFTPTEGPSPTPTPTDTLTPSPTPTPRPLRPAYLPIALLERCDPKIESTDVVLVIDVSSSMRFALDEGGVVKQLAAKRAARSFVSNLRAGHDQVAVVVFANEAELMSPLGSDPRQAIRAIDRLPEREGTNIGAGLVAAIRELEGPNRNPANSAAILLLTDGRPTRGRLDELRQAGRRARDLNISLFAIGLGSDVNPELLRELAGTNQRFFLAPKAEDLVGIYDRIARIVPCPGGRHDWSKDWP